MSKNQEYEIYLHKGIVMTGGIFFGCWWLFLAYMMVISRKEGVASIIMAYSFFAFATLHVIYVICKVSHSKFVVTDRTITRYFPFASPKIYCMDEISKVVIRVDKWSSQLSNL